MKAVSHSSLEQLELIFGSEFPTERAPERAALAARADVHALPAPEEAPWFDSEAPTGVAAERPVLPGPPRFPRL